eukprot:CAMPEP_0114234484 /NCGR_PEP_ID=MMETSP0058-20121206/5734_1 /TAXON_ID=36894 /ORGANISM="Pyramimonas parkeae, CCMP726" /LENGTH=158 /DNA_ID=CAMNT_0001346167 /DNA_START=208 /DNA_END=681 /DNA_ORIENTATION=-
MGAIEEARYCEETGAPLNDAARRIVELATQVTPVQSRSEEDTTSGEDVLAGIPSVELAHGKWKYVAIDISSRGGGTKRVVRSIANIKFHAQTFESTMNRLRPLGIEGRVVGGGRIEFYPETKTVSIYGYSKTFGRAPGLNENSAKIIEGAFPDYNVQW